MKKNTSYCTAAFRSIYLNNGVARPCCWYSRQEIQNKNTSLSDVNQVFLSKEFEEIREKMEAGIEIPACLTCNQHEKKGGKSHRTMWNQRVFNNDGPDHRQPGATLKALDLNMGNLCNLKCVMCDSYNSTSWLADEKKLYGQAQCNQKKIFDINNLDRDSLRNLEWLKLAGGEVFLMPEHKQLLTYLVEHNISQNIELVYVTNNTVSAQPFTDLWKHFKKIRLILSVDGVGAVNEYIRHPVAWETNNQIIDEFKAMQENLKISLEVNSVVSVLNVFHLLELDQWWRNKSPGSPIFYRLISKPDRFRIEYMSPSLKEKAAELYRELPQFQHVFNALTQKGQDPVEENDFFSWIQSLDAIRKTRFAEINPQFY